MSTRPAVLPPSRLKERRQKKRLTVSIVLLTLVFLVGAGGVALLYIPQLRIHDVVIVGAQTADPKQIETAVLEVLHRKVLYLLPKDSLFVYNDTELQGMIKKTFPKIKTATITLKDFHTIEVVVTERKPAALWCGAKRDDPKTCMYLDEGGVVFGEAPAYSGDAYVRWYGALPDTTELGTTYLAVVFTSLEALVKEFNREGLQVQSVAVDESGDVSVLCSDAFTIRFTLKQKPEGLLALLHAAQTASIFRDKKISDLEYLDLRFSDTKLYYKFK